MIKKVTFVPEGERYLTNTVEIEYERSNRSKVLVIPLSVLNEEEDCLPRCIFDWAEKKVKKFLYEY